MAVVLNPDRQFDFAYKGYQYPLPPSWKYAVRQQDQINWLLQALLKVNDEGVSVDYLLQVIDGLRKELICAYKKGDQAVIDYLVPMIAHVEERINNFELGLVKVRCPVTGERVYLYSALKQIYDMLRAHSMTYDQLKNTGLTWDQLYATGKTWFDIEMFANDYFGNGKHQAKYTPTDHCDEGTPGYVSCCCGNSGSSDGTTTIRYTGGDGVNVDNNNYIISCDYAESEEFWAYIED